MSNAATDTLTAYRQRALVLQTTCIVFGMIMMVGVAINFFITKDYFVGSSALGYSAFCLYLYRQIKRGNLKRWFFYANAIYLTAMMLNALISTPLNSGIIFAFICLPAIYYIFLNSRFAIVLTLLLFIILCPIIWMKMTNDFTLVNFSLIYIAMWTISHMHELSRQKQNQLLEYKATHDPLSGLKNRVALEQTTTHLATADGDYFLLYIDIDHFKQINDQYSHIVGDGVLKQTAEILQRVVCSEQIYRIGGEEFLCLIFTQQCRDILSLAERVRCTFDNSYYPYHDQQIQYTVSIGVSRIQANVDFNAALQLADKALYQAKRSGRNRVCVDTNIQGQFK